MNCPEHNIRMTITKTKYGRRADCPDENCTFVAWNGSKPANKHTRFARILAHEVFDRIWQFRIVSRKNAYGQLSKWLRVPFKKTHIGRFSRRQCIDVLYFCEWFVESKVL